MKKATTANLILMGKVEDCGLDSRTVRWMGNWLENHTQRVLSMAFHLIGRRYPGGCHSSGQVFFTRSLQAMAGQTFVRDAVG